MSDSETISSREPHYRHRADGTLVKVYYTGHPSPEEQVAAQVRSGSGMTYGVPSYDGARLALLPGRPR